MAKIKKFYIDDIAAKTQAMLQRAAKKHASINAFCIFVEGNHFYAITPNYENEMHKQRETRRLMNILIEKPELCKAFAEFVVPPARFFEREAKKAAKKAAEQQKITPLHPSK